MASEGPWRLNEATPGLLAWGCSPRPRSLAGVGSWTGWLCWPLRWGFSDWLRRMGTAGPGRGLLPAGQWAHPDLLALCPLPLCLVKARPFLGLGAVPAVRGDTRDPGLHSPVPQLSCDGPKHPIAAAANPWPRRVLSGPQWAELPLPAPCPQQSDCRPVPPTPGLLPLSPLKVLGSWFGGPRPGPVPPFSSAPGSQP